MKRPLVLILGPHRGAVSGVSTHLNLLMDSSLGVACDLVHFQVGSEGREEGALGKVLRLLASPFALAAAIVSRSVSIVHLNTSLNPRAYWRDLAYLFVARALGARVLYQVHGGKLPREFFASSPLLTAFLRWTLTVPDTVVVLAQCELEAYREFVPAQEVVVLPNGIDCRPFGAVPTVRSSPEEPLKVVYIGRVAREKGLYEALQGVHLARELGVDARLVIGGSGAEEARLRRYAQALGIGPRVSFAGAVFGEDKVRLLAGADVMVLPSYSEGLPYALLEGMAAGVPVIATPVGAIPDVVAQGIHGHLVPPRDARAIAEALALMAADRERLSWMSRACRRRVRAAFSVERLAAEFEHLYRVLCEGSVSAAGKESSPVSASPAPAAPRREASANVSGGRA